jgi:hypothetical protein
VKSHGGVSERRYTSRLTKWSKVMNTRNNEHALGHGHRSHPVTLLSAAVATADKALMAALESRIDIQLGAYHRWEAAGRPTGDGVQFWLEAEQQLAAAKEDNSGRGNSQDADRHGEIRHPHSVKL